jgi:hypothetical protein
MSETTLETFVISRDEFLKVVNESIQSGKESERKDIRARLEILRDISPVQSQISVALSAWIHELD